MYEGSNVAIVDNIKRDKRTRNVLAQTNTKTVSVPPASTGLVGDQAPAEVFTVADFDQVKNQVHLQEENFQLMEALNVMGQLTNMQSQSGPIPGTQFVFSLGAGSSGDHVIYAPAHNEVWQLVAASVGTISSGTNTVLMLLNDVDSSSSVLLQKVTTAQTQFDLNEPVFVSYPCRIVANLDAFTSGSTTIRVSLIRVR